MGKIFILKRASNPCIDLVPQYHQRPYNECNYLHVEVSSRTTNKTTNSVLTVVVVSCALLLN